MPKKSYGELLRDPRWQKLRLQVMERAGWKCEACGGGEETLNCHHGFYERGNMPWEYDINTLWCLCEGCHQLAEDARRDVYMELAHLNPRRLSPNMVLDLWTDSDREEADRRGDSNYGAASPFMPPLFAVSRAVDVFLLELCSLGVSPLRAAELWKRVQCLALAEASS